ncbi:MAG: hypothetical protein QW567_04315 [Candidatus Hadarchaeales archaeon]
MKKTLRRILPLWVIVLIGAGLASGAVLYTYVTTTFKVTIVENMGVSAALENYDFYIPDNGSANVKYSVTNARGNTLTLTVLSNVNENTENKLYFQCYRPWPETDYPVFVNGVNYGFSINNGQTIDLRVIIGDAGPALPNDTWSTLQLYVLDNALA